MKVHKTSHNRLVLAISAANGPVNWHEVESFAENNDWRVHELFLEDFGEIMKHHGFQVALDSSYSLLQKSIQQMRPDALLVASKGVGVVTFLALKGLWKGPVVLLSPIPNSCDHVIGGSWESEWESTIKVLVDYEVGPVVIGVGSTTDEQFLITEQIEDTGLCGSLDDDFFFENCPKWHLRVAEGGHSWKSDPKNAMLVAEMIDKVFELEATAKGDTCVVE
jgi:hypothetical protein